jgi:hypothetical protein
MEMANFLASATLVMVMKKSEADTLALRERIGAAFVLPFQPLAMACVFVKLTCNSELVDIKEDIAEVTSPCQFCGEMQREVWISTMGAIGSDEVRLGVCPCMHGRLQRFQLAREARYASGHFGE